MKFLFKGAECSVNKGTAAIMKSALLNLKNFFDNPIFLSITPYPELDEKNCNNIIFLKNLYSKSRIFKIFKYRKDFDCVIDLSGDTISDDYSKLTTFGLFYDLFIYKIILRKPYIIYAQSLGPFESIFTRIAAKLSFRLTDLIIIRENITKAYLEELGVENFKMGADPAFLLPHADKGSLKDIMVSEGIKNKNSFIGINTSQHIHDLFGDKSKDYISTNAELSDYLIENLGVHILMIPHVIHDGFDDVDVSMLVYDKIKNKDSVSIIKGNYSSEELKSIIGQCDLFIGARMHATIASTSQCIPTVGIAYSHKMHGIIGEMLGLEDYVIDLKELDSEILIEKTMAAWENRKEITEHLKRRIPGIKKMAMRNGELVKELCDSLGLT